MLIVKVKNKAGFHVDMSSYNNCDSCQGDDKSSPLGTAEANVAFQASVPALMTVCV